MLERREYSVFEVQRKLAQAGFSGLSSYIKALSDIRPEVQFSQSSLMDIAKQRYATTNDPNSIKDLTEKLQTAINNFVTRLPNLGNLNRTQQELAILAELDKVMKTDKTSSVGESGFDNKTGSGRTGRKAKEIRDIHTS